MDDPATSVINRLHDTKGLSSSQRAIADCLLGNVNEAAFWGVEELAERSRSSVATVVRFAQKLGYSGFMELRQALVAQAQERVRTDPADRLMNAPKDTAAMLLEVARRDMDNIERTVHGISERLLKSMAQRIHGARNRVVVGHGVSRIMADYLGYMLTLAGLVTVSGNAADFARQVANLDRKDLLVAISFPPYSQETLDVAEYAHRRGVTLLVFTDGLDSPLARFADHTIPLAGENLLFSHSLGSFTVVIHALATVLASRDRQGAVRRLKEAEGVSKTQFVR
jgi:DNA-binding MurR/RpiR family transcriptional regulator